MEEEERKEFLGISLGSLLANWGIIIVLFGFYLALRNFLFTFLPFAGTFLIILALIVNGVKGLGVKWRKINFFFHLFFLSVALFLILLLLSGKNTLR